MLPRPTLTLHSTYPTLPLPVPGTGGSSGLWEGMEGEARWCSGVPGPGGQVAESLSQGGEWDGRRAEAPGLTIPPDFTCQTLRSKLNWLRISSQWPESIKPSPEAFCAQRPRQQPWPLAYSWTPPQSQAACQLLKRPERGISPPRAEMAHLGCDAHGVGLWPGRDPLLKGCREARTSEARAGHPSPPPTHPPPGQAPGHEAGFQAKLQASHISDSSQEHTKKMLWILVWGKLFFLLSFLWQIIKFSTLDFQTIGKGAIPLSGNDSRAPRQVSSWLLIRKMGGTETHKRHCGVSLVKLVKALWRSNVLH